MKLLEQIFEIANKNPELIVLAEREQKFTYRQLFVAVSEISKQIKERTLVNRPILIFGKNDFISLAAMLAANLTGHAYISVDAHTPFERTEMINSAAKPAVVITTVNLSEDFSALFTDRISVNLNTLSLDEKLPELDFSQAVSGNDSNYIIYTSGTTGVPKGVEVSHANLVTFTNWMNNDFNKIENNQILSQALYSFDLSIFSLYPSLTTGGTLVSLSRDETTNFKLLFERLNSTVINTWISTPSFVDICLLDPSFTEKEHPNLVQFIFCGEELTKKTAEKLLTENDRLPIGFAKPGVELKIMDGEIIIIGDSVAKGYFENPEKTAQAFFAVDGKPAYHTGDAGSLTDEGMLRYQGRIDFQVKFNGFRIELQDIEANIQNLKDIEKAVVLPKSNDQHKVTALIAYLESEKTFADRAEERAFTKQLKAELSKTIMDYMMPTKFIYLKKFPLNQNGKVNRKALAQKERGDN